MQDKVVIPENLIATLAIIGRRDAIKEPMDGDEVDALCALIKEELNKHEGNWNKNVPVHVVITKKEGYLRFRDSEGNSGTTPSEDLDEFKRYWTEYHSPAEVTFEEV